MYDCFKNEYGLSCQPLKDLKRLEETYNLLSRLLNNQHLDGNTAKELNELIHIARISIENTVNEFYQQCTSFKE